MGKLSDKDKAEYDRLKALADAPDDQADDDDEEDDEPEGAVILRGKAAERYLSARDAKKNEKKDAPPADDVDKDKPPRSGHRYFR